ncbi:hypothetical protein ALT1644_440037 [Alteromonas macleodii]
MVTPAVRKPVTRHLIDTCKLRERVACKLAGVEPNLIQILP